MLLDGRKYVQSDRQGIAAVFERDNGLGTGANCRKEGSELSAERFFRRPHRRNDGFGHLNHGIRLARDGVGSGRVDCEDQ